LPSLEQPVLLFTLLVVWCGMRLPEEEAFFFVLGVLCGRVGARIVLFLATACGEATDGKEALLCELLLLV